MSCSGSNCWCRQRRWTSLWVNLTDNDHIRVDAIIGNKSDLRRIQRALAAFGEFLPERIAPESATDAENISAETDGADGEKLA